MICWMIKMTQAIAVYGEISAVQKAIKKLRQKTRKGRVINIIRFGDKNR